VPKQLELDAEKVDSSQERPAKLMELAPNKKTHLILHFFEGDLKL
jgi:hypothetical protein